MLRVVAGIVLVTAGLLSSIAPQPAQGWTAAGAPSVHSVRSLDAFSSNWAGYAVTGGSYSAVAGRWTVPRVVPSAGPRASAVWLGIDGVTNGSLIQVGTEQDSIDGRAAYFAWWEVLPAPAVRITSFAVRAGDRISASIQRVARGRWRISIRDARSGGFSIVRGYAGPGSSAEWIEEAPVESGHIMPLATVAPATFDLATVDGLDPGLDAASRVTLVRGATLATPSAPDRDGDGFTVRRGSVAPAPPSS